MIETNVKDQGGEGKPLFPLLMKSDQSGQIILAIKQMDSYNLEGITLKNAEGVSSVGEYSAVWPARCFRPFIGEITLKNKE